MGSFKKGNILLDKYFSAKYSFLTLHFAVRLTSQFEILKAQKSEFFGEKYSCLVVRFFSL
jgi:hypothetical protein